VSPYFFLGLVGFFALLVKVGALFQRDYFGREGINSFLFRDLTIYNPINTKVNEEIGQRLFQVSYKQRQRSRKAT